MDIVTKVKEFTEEHEFQDMGKFVDSLWDDEYIYCQPIITLSLLIKNNQISKIIKGEKLTHKVEYFYEVVEDCCVLSTLVQHLYDILEPYDDVEDKFTPIINQIYMLLYYLKTFTGCYTKPFDDIVNSYEIPMELIDTWKELM